MLSNDIIYHVIKLEKTNARKETSIRWYDGVHYKPTQIQKSWRTSFRKLYQGYCKIPNNNTLTLKRFLLGSSQGKVGKWMRTADKNALTVNDRQKIKTVLSIMNKELK